MDTTSTKTKVIIGAITGLVVIAGVIGLSKIVESKK